MCVENLEFLIKSSPLAWENLKRAIGSTEKINDLFKIFKRLLNFLETTRHLSINILLSDLSPPSIIIKGLPKAGSIIILVVNIERFRYPKMVNLKKDFPNKESLKKKFELLKENE